MAPRPLVQRFSLLPTLSLAASLIACGLNDVVEERLVITTEPTDAVSGINLASQPVVTIQNDRSPSGASRTVTATLASGTGSLVGTTTVEAIDGTARFNNLRIDGSGPHSVAFASTGLPTVVSATFSVTQQPAAVSVSTQPLGAATGAPLARQPVVQVLDNANLLIGSATNPVTAAIASGSGTLTGTTTVNASSGVASFTDLAISGSGTHTLVFSSTGLTSATSGSINISAPSNLAVSTQPAGARSGAALTTQPVVQIRDGSGNIFSGSSAVVTAAIATGSGSLSGTTSVTAASGLARFTDLAISGCGDHTIRFTSPGLTEASSVSFRVAADATQMAIVTQPGGAATRIPFTQQPALQMRDACGNVATNPRSVTAALGSGSGTLSGTTTVAASNGVVSFADLKITGTGTHALSFTSTGLASRTSSDFVVAAFGDALKLVITRQPAGAVSNANFTTQPRLEIRDAGDNLVSNSTLAVTVVIATGGGELLGTTTIDAVGGVVTFTNLAVRGSGPHSFRFTSGSLTEALSDTIVVAP